MKHTQVHTYRHTPTVGKWSSSADVVTHALHGVFAVSTFYKVICSTENKYKPL